jgi:hypothetical protein
MLKLDVTADVAKATEYLSARHLGCSPGTTAMSERPGLGGRH